MKLSVVIPAYNATDFIEKSYHSIINQDLQDFELIYVNNNSTDTTSEEIKKLVEMDSRVKLLNQIKQGAAAARNMGIQAAKGDYIYLFDVDDELYSNSLMRLMQVLDGHIKIDLVFGKMIKSHKSIEETPKPNDETFEVLIKDPPYWGLHWFSSLKNVVGPPAFLYRKQVFEQVGLYNEQLRLGQDTALDIKVGMQCNIAFLDCYIYLYRKHQYSTTDLAKAKMPRAFMVWPRLVKEHLPFYLNHKLPRQFEMMLFTQLFQTMGRQLEYTNGLIERFELKKELLSQIDTIKVPLVIRVYLVILALLPYSYIRKVYSYYVVPYVVKHIQPKKASTS